MMAWRRRNVTDYNDFDVDDSTDGSAEKAAEAFRNFSKQTTPIGAVILFAGEECPPGWFFCDGTQYPRSEFPDIANWPANLLDDATFTVPTLESPVPGLRYIIRVWRRDKQV
jgi:hypothetical protein